MEETANLKLPYILPSQAQKHVTHNEAIRALDALVQLSAASRTVTAPPAGPAEGRRYIVPAGATGAWAGHEGEVAAWQDGGWAFFSPRAGWRCWVEDEDVLALWTGAAWADAASAIRVLEQLDLLGVGTAADAENPFAARLNKALWTALPTGDGGTGDLRYTLNKEGAANALSLLFQSNWSGRAEIGLTGDDDLHVRVSPDGVAFLDALVIERATALLRHRDGTIPRTLFVGHGGSANDSLSGAGSFQDHTPAFELPAGFLAQGRALRVTVHFELAVSATPSAFSYRLKLGGTVVAEVNPASPTSSATMHGMAVFLVQATEAPGPAAAVVAAAHHANLQNANQASSTPQPVAVATDTPLPLVVASHWSSAGGGNVATLRQLVVEALN